MINCLFLLEKAEVYKKRGNDEYGEKNFSNAIHFYTEGIKVNCTDEELNAKLYSNRAMAHFYLGEPERLLFFASRSFDFRFMFNLLGNVLGVRMFTAKMVLETKLCSSVSQKGFVFLA